MADNTINNDIRPKGNENFDEHNLLRPEKQYSDSEKKEMMFSKRDDRMGNEDFDGRNLLRPEKQYSDPKRNLIDKLTEYRDELINNQEEPNKGPRR